MYTDMYTTRPECKCVTTTDLADATIYTENDMTCVHRIAGGSREEGQLRENEPN